MQSNLQFATNQQLRHAWAFAANKNKMTARRTRRRLISTHNYTIISCSPRAKELGIRVGMKYAEAKLRVPQLKILAIGGKHREHRER